MTERKQRELIFIKDAGLPAFADKERRVPLSQYEGVLLLFAATPGQTGAHVFRLTTRRNYYEKNWRVSSEWASSDVAEAWVLYRNQLQEVYTAGASIFVGDQLGEAVAE